MLDPRLRSALDRGATIVTPNKRLARQIVARHDQRQRADGRAAWPSARALPWPTFVDELWQAAVDAQAHWPPYRLDSAQCAHLWRRIVARDLHDAPLVDADAAAVLSAEAWELVHAYDGDARIAPGFADAGTDAAMFARWAQAFQRETARRNTMDWARATRALAREPEVLRQSGVVDVMAVGFLDVAPSQQRLLGALAEAGADVEFLRESADQAVWSDARLVAADSLRDELMLALHWARERALADANAVIGIVLLDLPDRRNEVRALAEDILCPSLQWPGCERAPRPYDLSAGESLSQAALVATALDLITLAHGMLDVTRAAALVRSPFLTGAEDSWPRRASLERKWLDAGRRELARQALIADLEGCDAALAQRLHRAMALLRLPKRATPRAWTEHWRDCLDAAGWCKEQALSSAQREAQGAWLQMLREFARLGIVTPELEAPEALAALRRAADQQAFQPEAPGARVQILGALEAAGLSFDALWVVGVSAEAWPRAPSPNPLLPIAWQRKHGVPRSHPARELDYARRLTARLSRSAAEVVFSYARRADDHVCAPSPLVAKLARSEPPAMPSSTARCVFDGRPALEAAADVQAPRVPAGTLMSGGASLVEAQSACPFRAAMLYRADAHEWPAMTAGVSRAEQGRLVHAALESFWARVQDHATLVTLSESELDAAIAQAVAEATPALRRERWNSLPPVVAAAEPERATGLVRRWLVSVERTRPPFRVVAREAETRHTFQLGGIALELRFDRLDAIGVDRVAIVDYKSGRAVSPARWFEARPQGVQLPLYAMAQAQRDSMRPVAALAYGQLKPGEVKAVGLVAERSQWPGLMQPGDLKGVALAGWDAARSRWEAALTGLAQAFGAGQAPVAPRDNNACKWCHLHAVCRIAAVAELATDEAASPDGEVNG